MSGISNLSVWTYTYQEKFLFIFAIKILIRKAGQWIISNEWTEWNAEKISL